MKKKITAISLIVLLFLVTISSFALANNNTITDITVKGNSKIEDLTVLKEINTQIGDQIVNEQLKKDLQAIYDLGYFSNVKINFKNYQNGVQLIFQVTENPVLSKIKIEGNQVITTEKIKDLLAIETGSMLNINDLKDGIKDVTEYYQQEGYVLARVVNKQIQNKDQLSIKINEGQLNKIKITGNQKTKDFVIRREFDIQPGDVFDMKQIKTDIRDIHQLKLFEQVQPQFKRLKENPQAVDLILNVSEKRTNSFQAGLTHSPNSGVAGLLDLTLKNYFGRAKKIKAKWEYGANKNYYELGYSDPWASWLFDRKTSIDFSLYNRNETKVDDDEFKKRGGDLSIGRQLTDNTKGYIGIDISKIKDNTEEETAWEDDRTLNLRTIRDTTTNPFNPRTGSKQLVSFKKSGLLGGDNNYTKYEVDLRKYLPSLEENSWAFRLKVAGSRENLTESERYYLAGRDGVRGYEDKYYKENEDTNYEPTTAGFIGNSMLLGSIEYRYPIVDKLRGVAFMDAGKTFSSDDINLSGFDNFKYSFGLGARIKTPIGELGLDYGYAPEAKRYSNSNFKFTIGNQF